MNFLAKYVSFSYIPFLFPLIMKGRYRLITPDDAGIPIISTTFYIDGDTLTELNTVDEQILAELHTDKVEDHLNKVAAKAGSVELFRKQLHLMFATALSLLPWIYNPLDHLYVKAIITAGIGVVFYFLRNIISRFLMGAVNKLIRPLMKLAGFIKK